MLLKALLPAGCDKPLDLRVEGGRIAAMAPASLLRPLPGESVLSLEGCLVFPGLINSHDHLDFDLFPRLGHRRYASYLQWGPDIHHRDADRIAEVLRIPAGLRAAWGLYRNLLCGVTSVHHHGQPLPVPGDVIEVISRAYSLHSLGLGGHWKMRLNLPRRHAWPWVLHIAEGTDETARRETARLFAANWTRRPLIGVHAVATDPALAARFRAIVWCPDSNFFLLGRTADIPRLKLRTGVLFGTDSTLSASWDLWEQLRLARATGMLTDGELFDALTAAAAKAWELPGKGRLAEGAAADIVIARPAEGRSGWDAFYSLDPGRLELVLCGGRIRLISRHLKAQLGGEQKAWRGFYPVRVGERVQHVWGNLPGILAAIRTFYPGVQLPVVSC